MAPHRRLFRRRSCAGPRPTVGVDRAPHRHRSPLSPPRRHTDLRALLRRTRCRDLGPAATRLPSRRNRRRRRGCSASAPGPSHPSHRGDHDMKLANIDGRAALVLDDGIADVAEVSGGAFGPDPMSPYREWEAFVDFAETVTAPTGPMVEADLRCPVPEPRQVFGIGLNYRTHAEESGMQVPDVPAT